MNKQFTIAVEQYANRFDEQLKQYMQTLHIQPKLLQESMQYSLSAGGKRLRPVLMYAVTDMLGGDLQSVTNLAIAMEMVHTYSLIHDDLPAMDNASLRRNMPTSHIQFGEGQAILAGDALLSQAFSICMQESLRGTEFIQAGICLAQCAGAYGMVAGQMADICYQNNTLENNAENLQFIHLYKTGKLLIASLLIPAYLQHADANILKNLYQFGEYLGKIYQLTDDLLDMQGNSETVGKDIGIDAKNNKLSALYVYGLERCQQLLQEYKIAALQILKTMPQNTQFLQDFIHYLIDRKK